MYVLHAHEPTHSDFLVYLFILCFSIFYFFIQQLNLNSLQTVSHRVNMMLCLFLLHALIIHAQPKLYSCFEHLFNKTFF